MELGNVGESSTDDHTRDGENTAQCPVHVYETIIKNDIGVDFDHTYDQLAIHEFGNTDLDPANMERLQKKKWKQKCMLSVLIAGFAVVIAVGTIIFMLPNRDSQKDISTTDKHDATATVPFPAVFCTDAPSLLDFGPIQIVCVITTTSFSMINVTFKESYGADSLLISRIKSDGSIINTITNDNIVISYALSIVTIAIYNVSCPYNGFYMVSVDSENNLTGRAEWQLSVKAKPSGAVQINLHPEQITILGTIRSNNLHSCAGDIGNPGGKIGVELLLDGHLNFEMLDPSFTSITDNALNCTVFREFRFWINFTTEMNNAAIRCKLTNDEFHADPPIYSQNKTLAIVQRN
ncbi:Hypothetical predicted protein [Mytilus galloprovincialis]|uniref:Uncharacterized protein n=1 Tax=Mytilus galloprovincialis TaxID=29158 RepID=A0A8B6E853_MYTGA|nr:Hypothetical predicted protein [Mytilus galloprovincialis]